MGILEHTVQAERAKSEQRRISSIEVIQAVQIQKKAVQLRCRAGTAVHLPIPGGPKCLARFAAASCGVSSRGPVAVGWGCFCCKSSCWDGNCRPPEAEDATAAAMATVVGRPLLGPDGLVPPEPNAFVLLGPSAFVSLGPDGFVLLGPDVLGAAANAAASLGAFAAGSMGGAIVRSIPVAPVALEATAMRSPPSPAGRLTCCCCGPSPCKGLFLPDAFASACP